MNGPAKPSYHKLYVVMNPVAGNASVDDLCRMLEENFSPPDWSYEVYQTTGEEDISEITRLACEQGADLVIAAGGDGTVSGVANGLVGLDVPLGIIPAGTGNGLARAMSIPLDTGKAIRLLAGEHLVYPVDAMQVGEKYYILNVSAGISSRAMRDTPPEEKRRKGMLAYVQVFLRDLIQPRTSDFNLTLDGHRLRLRAAEILVANGTLLKDRPLIFGDREFYNDGEFEVNLLLARDAADYMQLAWELLIDPDKVRENLRDLRVRKSIRLEVVGKPLPVQADGELIGETPVEVSLVPGAFKVIVPKEDG